MKRVALFVLLFVLLGAVAISQSYKTPWFESEVIKTDTLPLLGVTRYQAGMIDDDRLELNISFSHDSQYSFKLTVEQSQKLAHALLKLSERPENIVSVK